MNTKAAVIAWESILKTIAVKNISEVCSSFDIALEHIPMNINCDSQSLWEIIQKYTNVITWVCPSIPEELQKRNRNILFMDNSVLDPGKFLYLDDNGFGKNSNIVLRKYNKKDYTIEEKQEILTYLSFLHWPQNHIVDKKGYIVVALQNHFFEDQDLLDKCQRFLPYKAKVRLRPRLGADEALTLELCKGFCQRNEEWTIETDLEDFELLRHAKALVTNYSDLLYKALYMRIPVATCSTGLHTGTNATLDCSKNPEKLAFIFDYYFNEKDSQNLIYSVYSNSISKNISKKDILTNTNIGNWLRRIKNN